MPATTYIVTNETGQVLGAMSIPVVLRWVPAPFAYSFTQAEAEALAAEFGGTVQPAR